MLKNPSGLCQCGCGGTTTRVAEGRISRGAQGYKPGEHYRFLRGHNRRHPPDPYVVNPETGCWDWHGTITPSGYGAMMRNYRVIAAHRFYYERHVGPIPEGLVIDHLCRNTRCVNPAHLEPVTVKENNLRGISPYAINARKTECMHGHPFDEENTWVSKKGQRHCRECARRRDRERSARERAARELAA